MCYYCWTSRPVNIRGQLYACVSIGMFVCDSRSTRAESWHASIVVFRRVNVTSSRDPEDASREGTGRQKLSSAVNLKAKNAVRAQNWPSLISQPKRNETEFSSPHGPLPVLTSPDYPPDRLRSHPSTSSTTSPVTGGGRGGIRCA